LHAYNRKLSDRQQYPYFSVFFAKIQGVLYRILYPIFDDQPSAFLNLRLLVSTSKGGMTVQNGTERVGRFEAVDQP